MAEALSMKTAFRKILLEKETTSASTQENECPLHSRYALPSLTLQDNGCLSCAALNQAKREMSSKSSASSKQEPAKNLTRPCKGQNEMDTWDTRSRFGHSRGRSYQERSGFQKPKAGKYKDDLEKIRKVFELSGTFTRQVNVGYDPNIFDGAGVNPYIDDQHLSQ